MTVLTWNAARPHWQKLLGQATSWWLAELAGLLPQRAKSIWARSSARVVRMDFARDGATLVVPGRDRGSPVILPVSTDPNERAGFNARRLAPAPVQIVIDPGFAFKPVIDLPLAAESSLAAILRNQLERLVPLDPETLRFTWNIVERLPGKNRLKVEVCIVKQATIERAIDLAEEIGLRPQSVSLLSPKGDPQILWRAASASYADARMNRMHRALEGAAVICCLLSYGLLVSHLDARRAALRDMIANLHAKTATIQVSSAQAQKVEHVLDDVRARLAAPPPLALLDVLTRAIPLDSSVSEFHLQNGRIEISGIATHATTLLDSIGKTGLFEDIAFTAPIISVGQNGGERYQLAFKIKPGARP
jgi:general secretion pathway protein L